MFNLPFMLMSRLSLLAVPAGRCALAALLAGAGPAPEPAAQVAIFDGHNDVATQYVRSGWSLESIDMSAGLPGQSDIPRWRAGHVVGALITVGSDRGIGGRDHFPRLLVSLDWFDALVREHRSDLVALRSASQWPQAGASGRIALIPAIEGGDQIDGSLDNLRIAYRRGVRAMTIVYDHHNAIGDGAMVLEQSRAVAHAPWGGLSPFGRDLVREMNRLGMIVDLSHAAETTARDALLLSRAPIIFSHSGARARADSPRNLSDEMLALVGARGGMVMIPLAPYLITTEYWRWWSAGEARYAALVAAHPDDESRVESGMAEWDRSNPEPRVTVADVADQIDHVARIAGHDHVGIGTDFDGMGRFAIEGIAHSGQLQSLFAELRRRGWTEAQLAALGTGNFRHLLAQVEAAAAGRRSTNLNRGRPPPPHRPGLRTR